MEQKPAQQKIYDSKIQAMEMKSLRAILNKAKIDRVRNTNTRLELGKGENKNVIQKSRLRWFGHVKQMKQESIPKKILQIKMEKYLQ